MTTDLFQKTPVLAGAQLPWLNELRADAKRAFDNTGFPTAQHEDWRFTKIDTITETAFTLGQASDATVDAAYLESIGFKGLAGLRLVFVNGHYNAALSTAATGVAGLTVSALPEVFQKQPQLLQPQLGRIADYGSKAFTAINTAFLSDGVLIRLAKGTAVEQPIQLIFVAAANGQPTVNYPRVSILLEEGAEATVIENYVSTGTGKTFTNAVTEASIGDNARLNHYKIERESLEAAHISTLQAHQQRSSNFSSFVILVGGALVRNNIETVFQGEGAECNLKGLYLGAGAQHMDTYTVVDHAKAHGTSNEYYKGVLDDKAQAVFNGKVIVALDAQKTDAVQTNKNLLLSDGAQINTKPELKIFANDVKCKHGATIGQISAEALFYLRSRGVPKEEARKLLIYAFASELIEGIALEPIRESLHALLLQKFQNR